MNYWMLTWNRDMFPWPELPDLIRELSGVRIDESVSGPGTGASRWTVSSSKHIHRGDRLLLLKQGSEPRGFVGSARAVSDSAYEDDHWSEPRKTNYVDLEWEVLLDPEVVAPIHHEHLPEDIAESIHWAAQRSGERIDFTDGETVYELLMEVTGSQVFQPATFEAEARQRRRTSRRSGRNPVCTEGELRTSVHKRRERAYLREPKLDAIRSTLGFIECEACQRRSDPDVPITESAFEVHHLLPLETGPRHTQLSDLSILCANCHRIVHAMMRDTNDHIDMDDLRGFLAVHSIVE